GLRPRPPAPRARAPAASPSPSPAVAKPVWTRISGRRVCMANCRYVGVAVASPNALAPFVSATGVKPKLVETYARFGTPFPLGYAKAIAAEKQLLMIQVNPFNTDLASIAAGQSDAYLTSYAAELKQFGGPVALSFGHEMNGGWYPWGCNRTKAKLFIAAWRRVVHVISHAGAHNVIW